MILLYHLVAHPRAVVHALDMGRGDYLDKVFVALVVLGQEDEVVVGAVGLVLEAMVADGDVDLTAYDGLYRGVFLGEFEELLDPVHIAVVSDRKTGHSELLGPGKEVIYRRLTVEDGVLCMNVQMSEGHNLTKVKKNRGLCKAAVMLIFKESFLIGAGR